MSYPRMSKGDEPEPWAGGVVSERMLIRTPLQILRVDLKCPSCRPGTLTATGAKHDQGNIHTCDNCLITWVVPGEPYPRRIEQPDPNANLMKAR